MCGILGGNISNWNYKKGIEAIKHRGPDGQRVVEFELCTLGFARLSIMDLSERAMQPFTSADGKVTIVFNGEIYGFSKLQRNLRRKYDFCTTSDTEVILYAYMEYGDSFIDYIDGMFAIVIYDSRIECLKLYRDRYGIKPFYYYSKGNQFAFASEIKAFTAACQDKVMFKIDNTAIYDYLVYQYIPEPKSMYKDIYKLEPATYIHYDLRRKKIVKKGKYWNLRINTKAHGKRKRDDILYDIRTLIERSVQKQMVADVAVGTFLSGGVDSSIISYECSRINPEIKSFSIGFNEKDFDESKYAEIVSKYCKINGNVKKISAADVKNMQGMLQSLYDEPFADTSAYPTYILSKYARQEVSVVLTGDGGDELFGGYERYKTFYTNRKKRILENAFLTYANLVGIFDEKTYEDWRLTLNIDKDYNSKWYLQKYYHKELPPMTRMRYLDFKTYLPSDILTKVDRTSMRVSLEARIPFLDRELVEYIFGLAEDEYFYDGELKILLKKAYEEILPKEILYRKKRGFSIPSSYITRGTDTKYATILRQEWKEVVSDVKKNRRKEKVHYYN